jgi:hypothetical protein
LLYKGKELNYEMDVTTKDMFLDTETKDQIKCLLVKYNSYSIKVPYSQYSLLAEIIKLGDQYFIIYDYQSSEYHNVCYLCDTIQGVIQALRKICE